MIFNVSVFNLINLIFIAAGIGVCSLSLLQLNASSHLQKEVRRYFQIFFSLIILYISAHLARQLMEGLPGNGVRIALYIVTFIEMLAAGLMSYQMSLLILFASKTDKKTNRIFGILILVLLCLHIGLLSFGWKIDLFYYFDASNNYHRSSAYIVSNLCPFAMLLGDIVILIRFRKNINSKLRSAFWLYLIAPIIAMGIQFFSYGIQFIIFATVGAAVYMFSVIVENLNKKYETQQKDKSRIETELTTASSIQAAMLPNIYPAFPDRQEFDIYATMDPAKEVGGDFYDFFLIDDDHLCLVMADVSGKGIPAALFMMASRIIIANNAKMGKTPAQILADTNSTICSNNKEDMFVTVWLGILELSSGKLTAANAGHEFPALKPAGDSFMLYKDKHGFVIGGMDGLKYKEYEIQMKQSGKLFLYTDGVPEATDSSGNLFGVERMIDALNSEPNAQPEKILKNVRAHVDEFVKDAEQFDDLTMLCVEYKGTDN